ncbi:MAG: CDP-alcohol phosphatidyltransferase family protein [Rhodothermia bacterium]|nr:CDP-alcohol phosphatidyltransferase family protein [Rhodothermia bacterium]
MANSVQVTRTREIEELSNLYLVHPVSKAFVRVFARIGVHPNAVSVFGMIFGALAAVAYFNYREWEFAVAGFFFMFLWHVMDGADGQLARLTGKTSEIGKVLDGLCDHLSFSLVYVAIATALTIDRGAWVWIPAFAAGFSHIAQSSAYEFQRQNYDYWVHGKESARVVASHEIREMLRGRTGISAIFARVQLLYVIIQETVAAYDGKLMARLEELKRKEGSQFARVRDLYRSVNMPAVRRWSILSSNYRTLAIFVSVVIGFPLLYFVIEIVALNIVLILLLRMQKRTYATLRRRLDGGKVETTAEPSHQALGA